MSLMFVNKSARVSVIEHVERDLILNRYKTMLHKQKYNYDNKGVILNMLSR